MPGHYFISYSARDGNDFAQRLHQLLHDAGFDAWIFNDELRAGLNWESQLSDAIRDCAAVVFVLTPDSVHEQCVCHFEYLRALQYKRPIIPVKAHTQAELPFLLSALQYLDFTNHFDTQFAKLIRRLRDLASPAGELEILQDRLKSAERDLLNPNANRARIEADIAQLKQDIEKQKRVVANPDAEAQRTAQSIQAGIERAREPEKPVGGATRTKFINPPPMTAPRWWQDRYRENEIIRDFLRDDAMRLLTLNGRAGIGKTTLVCRLLKSLEAGYLPDDLGALNVDGIVYLSAIGTRAINTPNLFADLCKLLPDATAPALDAIYRDPQIAPREKLLALAEKFPRGRVIVLLDNFESALDANGDIADAELDAALRALLDAPHHAIKIILTTRVAPRALQLAQPARQTYLPLDEGLPVEFAIKMLREMDASGIVHLKDADDALLARAREYTRGFPRALEALYAILAADRYTTLEEILAQPRMPENIVHALVGEMFNRLDPVAERVMIALATFNRPVPPAALDYLLQPFLPSVDSAPVLNRLVNMQFARRESGRYHLHPVDREYAFNQVKSEKEKGKSAESNWTQHDLQTRAADYFAATRKPRETWKTLQDLEPQLNEFDLRCAAEDYNTAASVLLEIDFDYLLLWGHFRLMIELHEKLQGEIRDSRLKENSAGNLGTAYRNIGQARTAIIWSEKALAIAREEKNRGDEGVWLGNLGLAYSDLGDTRRAITFYEQALAIAREIGDKRGEGADLGNLGLAYSALGDTRRAITFYEQALAIAQAIGDKRGEGADLGNLGLAYNSICEFT
jgi:tetratricopeptide (TPR) repeat protein